MIDPKDAAAAREEAEYLLTNMRRATALVAITNAVSRFSYAHRRQLFRALVFGLVHGPAPTNGEFKAPRSNPADIAGLLVADIKALLQPGDDLGGASSAALAVEKGDRAARAPWERKA